MTLRVYAHWLSETTGRKGVDRLDENPAVAQPLHKPTQRARRDAA